MSRPSVPKRMNSPVKKPNPPLAKRSTPKKPLRRALKLMLKRNYKTSQSPVVFHTTVARIVPYSDSEESSDSEDEEESSESDSDEIDVENSNPRPTPQSHGARVTQSMNQLILIGRIEDGYRKVFEAYNALKPLMTQYMVNTTYPSSRVYPLAYGLVKSIEPHFKQWSAQQKNK